MLKNFFVKSHGLGNDYIVLDEANITFSLNEKIVRLICDTHYGIGSDGILLLVPGSKGDFRLRIFNPDGSEAEKSGNGLRIFCKFLYDYKYTRNKKFTIETLGGVVKATINEEKNGKASLITIEMGKATFKSVEVPVNCEKIECLDYSLTIGDKKFLINCVSVGNPHCVIICNELNMDEVLTYGPKLEVHPMFPNRINVQFVKPVSDSEAEILIWERGAGYTLASGSSSCAVASILKKKGLAGNDVKVKMPGGILKIGIDNEWNLTLCGGVKQIAEGYLDQELIEDIDLLKD
jgi:diaminopimelate epimerase